MDLETISTQSHEESSLSVQEPRQLVKDLFEPKANIFWTDLLLSVIAGWSAFVASCMVKPMSWQMFVFVAVAVIALYRALVFIHELSHFRENKLPGFTKVWNLLVGIPLLFPSFVYVGIHADHHRLSSYGTTSDPEYMPFAGKRGAIIFFIAHSVLIPVFLLIRFLLLSPLGLLIPSLHRFLERHASSLSMNLAYCRKIADHERANMMAMELLIIGFWSVPIAMVIYGIVPWRVFLIWYGVMGCITVTNSLRTLGAHRYQSSGELMNRDSQLLDSIDTPGNFWTIIWAPVGLRYHALHHYFPSIPYHNLPIAYQRLITNLPVDSVYRKTTSHSLWHSLQILFINKSFSM